MFVVSYGNVFDGIRLVGPFSTFDEAFEFADGSDGPWEIAEMQPPAGEFDLEYYLYGHLNDGDVGC
jgi:hypothetical protein